MSRFRVAVHIVPRKGILDPQGKAVSDALHSLGFDSVTDTRIGRHIVLHVAAPDASAGDGKVLIQKSLGIPPAQVPRSDLQLVRPLPQVPVLRVTQQHCRFAAGRFPSISGNHPLRPRPAKHLKRRVMRGIFGE